MRWIIALLLALISGPALAQHTVNCVVYGAQSGIVRMVMIPDNDKQCNDPALVSVPGTAMLTVPVEQPLTAQTVAPMIKARTGVTPGSGRTAVVTNGTVTNVILADPVIDAVPGAQLLPSDTAAIGATVTNGVITNPVAVGSAQLQAPQ